MMRQISLEDALEKVYLLERANNGQGNITFGQLFDELRFFCRSPEFDLKGSSVPVTAAQADEAIVVSQLMKLSTLFYAGFWLQSQGLSLRLTLPSYMIKKSQLSKLEERTWQTQARHHLPH